MINTSFFIVNSGWRKRTRRAKKRCTLRWLQRKSALTDMPWTKKVSIAKLYFYPFVFINFVFYSDKLSNRSNILKKQQQKLSGNRQIRSFRIIVFGEPHLPFFGICSGQMIQHRVRVVESSNFQRNRRSAQRQTNMRAVVFSRIGWNTSPDADCCVLHHVCSGKGPENGQADTRTWFRGMPC